MTLTADRFEVGQEGGTIHVEVKSNISYEVVIPDEYKGWISQNRNARGLNVSNVSFEIAPSEEYDKREGEIIIQSGYKKEIVKEFINWVALYFFFLKMYTKLDQKGIDSG